MHEKQVHDIDSCGDVHLSPSFMNQDRECTILIWTINHSYANPYLLSIPLLTCSLHALLDFTHKKSKPFLLQLALATWMWNRVIWLVWSIAWRIKMKRKIFLARNSLTIMIVAVRASRYMWMNCAVAVATWMSFVLSAATWTTRAFWIWSMVIWLLGRSCSPRHWTIYSRSPHGSWRWWRFLT